MKEISTYLFEASNKLNDINGILSQIINCKFNFTKSHTDNKQDRITIAKKQEREVISVLAPELPGYEILSCEEWCERMKLNYSPKIDSFYGDIMIVDENDKTIYNIDLKVGSKDYVGTPDALSLSNFGNVSVKEAGIFIYLCCNENGNSNVIISHDKLFNIQKRGKFIISKDRKNVLKSNTFTNAKLLQNKSAQNTDTSKLYEEDFVPTSTIMTNKDF